MLDLLSIVIRGKGPFFDGDSYLYSVRGLIVLISLIFVTAVTADWLRQVTTLSEWVVTLLGFAVGIGVILGPITAYYWRKSVDNHPPT